MRRKTVSVFSDILVFLVLGVVAAALMALSSWIQGEDIKTALQATVVVLALHGLIFLIPPSRQKISLYSDRIRFGIQWPLHFRKIEHCSMGTDIFAGEQLHFLKIVFKNESEITVGLDPKISLSEFESNFRTAFGDKFVRFRS